MFVILDPSSTTAENIAATLEALALLDTQPVSIVHMPSFAAYQIQALPNSIREEDIRAMPGVIHVIAPKPTDKTPIPFIFNDVEFSAHKCQIFAGLNAIGHLDEAKEVFNELKSLGLTTTRVGVYKPRTYPHGFQGLGEAILGDLFDAADSYGIKIICMEVLSEYDIAAVQEALKGHTVEVMWQVGTRNAQNFALLKALAKDTSRPILYKRGFGNTVAELCGGIAYLEQHGAPVITCLRGVKSAFCAPYRNMSDFGQIPHIKRATGTFICADPSHSAGMRGDAGLTDIHHLTAQAVIAGANMLLTDFHPAPEKSKVDSRQSLPLSALKEYVEDVQLVHRTYLRRLELVSCKV